MPAAIAVPAIATAIAGGAAAGASIYGSHKAATSNRQAAQLQAEANRRAEQIAQEAEQRRRQEYDQEQANLKAQWEAHEARRAPYREVSANAVMRLAQLAGVPMPQSAPLGARPMPPGWDGSVPQSSGRTMPLSSFLPQSRVGQLVATPMQSAPLPVQAVTGDDEDETFPLYRRAVDPYTASVERARGY